MENLSSSEVLTSCHLPVSGREPGPHLVKQLASGHSISTRRGRSLPGALITPVYQLAVLKSCARVTCCLEAPLVSVHNEKSVLELDCLFPH